VGLSVIQYVGGKGTQLNDLLPLIPYSRGYVEPFGGGASILLNRRKSPLEVYNDLNGGVVALFRVMQDPAFFTLFVHRIEHTPFAKDEFRRALVIQQEANAGGPVNVLDRAWALYVIQNMGISGAATKEGNWSRSLKDSINTVRWYRRIGKLEAISTRFRNVQIDSQDALECMRYWDAEDVVHYVDPPYVLSTRSDRKYYRYEMDEAAHDALVECLLGLQGMVVLSGYDHPVYQPLIDAGWEMRKYSAKAYSALVKTADGEGKPDRVEAVWRNPRCAAQNRQLGLDFQGRAENPVEVEL
jgi:DNA adenine methylase